MPDARSPWRSVRVRITAAATVVVGVTMIVASFALVAAVRHQLLDKLEARSRAKVQMIAEQIASGVPPDVLRVGLPPPEAGFVVVQNADGEVIKAFGAAAGGAKSIFVEGPAPAPGETAGVTLEAADTPFDVRYTKVLAPDGPLTVFAGAPLDGIQRSVRALQSSLAVGIPFLIAIVGGLAWFVTGRALRPVEAIRSEVEEISGGTLHRRVPEPDTGDEVSRLAHTMNAMLDRLELSSDRQRQFVSDASHELRSPVAAIRTHLEVGLANPATTDWPAVAQKALAEEGRLETLVSDLLLLASVDEQRMNRAVAEVDLAAIARDETSRVRRLPVAVEAGDPVMVRGHADRLARVIANLLDNASRHASSTVRLAVTREGDAARLVVEDDGAGIPVADRDRVFERFTRLDGSRVRSDSGGAGLGLALAKVIVEHHGGTIAIEDAAPTGARFVVSLRALPESAGQISGESEMGTVVGD